MKELYKSLAAFQQEVPAVYEGTKGYGYDYADLPTIFKTINPILKKHNLGFTQLLDGVNLKTVIFHTESGDSLECLTDIPQNVSLKGMNAFQIMGSSITYIRRYALSSALGLVTDKDTDASGEQVKQNTSEPTEWLNLLNKDGKETEQFKAIKKAVESGSKLTLSSIRKKYKVSKGTAEQLKDNFNIV